MSVAAPPRRVALGPRTLTSIASLGVTAVLIVWWQSAPSATGSQGWTNGVSAIGRITGLLASYLALLQLVLMARIPWIERGAGLPRITAWHRALGADTVLLMSAHVALITWGYALRARRNVVSEFATLITTYPAMIRAIVAAVLFWLIAITSVRALRRRLPYEAWWLIHLTAYAAVALSITHQLRTGEVFALRQVAQDIYVGLTIAVIVAAVWWRVVLPVRTSWIHRVRIERSVQEAHDTYSLWLGGEGLERLDAHPGQYVIVRFLARGHWTSGHPYSLSSPVVDGRLRITIKALGDHSGGVQQLAAGTRAVIEGPFGTFTSLAARPAAPALLIGGGVGITPLRGLAEELSQQGRDVVVVHRVGSDADLVHRHELAALPVTVHPLVGHRRELGHDPLEASRLAALVKDIAERDVWICGPEGMTWLAVQSCRTLGVRDEHIQIEEFAL